MQDSQLPIMGGNANFDGQDQRTILQIGLEFWEMVEMQVSFLKVKFILKQSMNIDGATFLVTRGLLLLRTIEHQL